jgi:tight adherence protein B
MLAAVLVFLLGAGSVLGAYALVTRMSGGSSRRRMDERLQELTASMGGSEGADIVMRRAEGATAALDRMVGTTRAGLSLRRVVEQSGLRTSPGRIVVMSLVGAAAAALLAEILTRQWMFAPVAAIAGGSLPMLFVLNRRNARMRRFEEQFPEALDLMSRALKAGHAFQSAMGMAGDELQAPVGPEFKKTFDQQNFGLPLREALLELAERVPLMDVRFFVTAVLIQRETGGNLSEILENLAHVVRERFKILRQVRVHTAHGRFTGFVLLALPAGLAMVLQLLNPDHMSSLFNEHMGQLLLLGAIVMQAIGFVWIRQVIKIEV